LNIDCSLTSKEPGSWIFCTLTVYKYGNPLYSYLTKFDFGNNFVQEVLITNENSSTSSFNVSYENQYEAPGDFDISFSIDSLNYTKFLLKAKIEGIQSLLVYKGL